MRVARNKYLVEVNDQFVRPTFGGITLDIDTDFHPMVLATKVGKVHTLPIAMSGEYKCDTPINVGDTVVFNHLVCQNANKFQENIFFCDYFHIYAKLEKENIVPIEDVLFCEKMYEPDINIGSFKVEGNVSGKYAKVLAVSKHVASEGIQVGDVVFFTKNADYEVNIAGKEVYRMHLRNIIGIERDGKLKTFRNRLLVKNITKFEKAGQMERMYASSNLQTGIVMQSGSTNIAERTLLTYFDGISTKVDWKGENYSFISQDHIKFII